MHDDALSHQEKQLHVQAIWAGKVDGVNMSASFTNHRATVESLALLEPVMATSRHTPDDGSEPDGGSQPKLTAADATSELDPHLYQAMALATWVKPSYAPDTLLLTLNAGQATWIPIWEVTCGATAIQSLPSGSTGDVSGAQLATIEKVLTFRRGVGVIDIAQLGKAHITKHHPILAVDGWMTAS